MTKILAHGLKASNTESKSPQEVFLMGNAFFACSDDEARDDRSCLRDVPFPLVQVLVILSKEQLRHELCLIITRCA